MINKIKIEKLFRKSKTRLKKILWDDYVKPYIRLKYGNTCYTCETLDLKGSNWHVGHCIPSVICGIVLRYDERDLRPQCYNCNINCGGYGAMFIEKFRKEFGEVYIKELFELMKEASPYKNNKQFYIAKIIEYGEKIKELPDRGPG